MGNVSHFVNLCITHLILVSLALAEGQKCREPELFGCRQDIELNDKELVRRVNFAIAEHNKKAGKNLILVKVIIGMKQPETNNDYKFLISTKDGTNVNANREFYIANVYAKCPKKGGLGFEYSANEVEDLRSLYGRWRAYYKLDEPTNDRFPAFRENVLRIHRFNQLDEPYKLGLNQFSDLTAQEFAALHRCQPGPRQPLEEEFGQEHDISDLPTSVDWRAKGAVTYVKNQLNCRSCWAFSAVGAVEGINFLQTRRLVSLSAQELVDCDKHNSGCRGGSEVRAFDFIRDRGITSERVYPYVGKQRICNSTKVKSPVVKITGYKRIPPNNEKALMKAVAQQPVSAAIAADNDFGHYKTGIYTGNCTTDLDHAVTVVGYGTTKQGIKYWIVKNSWGGSWGESGYIRMARDVKYKSGMCGIAMEASYPMTNVLSAISHDHGHEM
ncbi:cysteine proteinases superfamily protein [Striga asiatica]|uniref:Cysteine proteinases superfamily protein n=1 Tax=Striga asiatica TaxID=4170 RepID=A0A5A7RHQ0_STRAF|nr:cysteine proteinases superfamily protein [Striga asiatica]